MASNSLSREHSLSEKEQMETIYTYGIIKRSPNEHNGAPGEKTTDGSSSSPIEDYERTQLERSNSDSTWNNPKDSYGSVPYDGTDTSMLLPPEDPNYDTAGSNNSPPVTTTTSTSGGITPAGRTVSAAAIIIPVFLILALVTCLGWLFHASGYNLSHRIRSRRSSKDIDPATVASDLETGQPPRSLSPSAVPTARARVTERGWLFTPNVPAWVRGYRRRSDPRGAGNEDWQLDINDIGEAPPDYAEAEREKQMVDTENVRRMNTNDTTLTGETRIGRVRSQMSLPAYNAVVATRRPPQQLREDEVHGRAAEQSGDLGNAREGEEKY